MSDVWTSYLTSALCPEERARIIDWAVQDLEPYVLDFQAVAVTGVSGLLIGPSVADRLHKRLIVVRKTTPTHSPLKVEGWMGPGKYLVLDDFVDRGSTLRTIVGKIGEHMYGLEPFGFYGYVPRGSDRAQIAEIFRGLGYPRARFIQGDEHVARRRADELLALRYGDASP